MTARMRGSASGVVAQTIEVPARFFLCTPAMASEGWAFDTSADTRGHAQIASYLAPVEFDKAMGTLANAVVDFVGDEHIKTLAGEFPVRHFKLRLDHDTCDYWLHSQLGIPVRALGSNGHEYVLTSLSDASANK